MKLRPWKWVLSLVFALAVVFAMPCVVRVYAADDPLYYLDSGGEVKEAPESTQNLDTEASVWGTEGTETWYYIKNDPSLTVDGLQQDVTVWGDVHLILDNSASYNPIAYLRLQDGVCLTIPSGSSLTIYTKKPEYETQIPGIMDVSARNERGSVVKVEKGGTLRVVSSTLRSVGISTISGTDGGTIELDGTLIVEDGGTLVVTRSGVLEVHEGGEVIVQDGGSFDLQTRNDESTRGGICYLDGTVTVETGGNLFFGTNSFMYINPTGYLDVEDPENIKYEENGNGCIILADNNGVSENILETTKDYTRYFINGIQLEGYEDASPHIAMVAGEMTTFTAHIQTEGENPNYTIQFLNISGVFQIRSVIPCPGNTFQFTLSSDSLFEDDHFTISVKLYNKEEGGYLLDVVTMDVTADCILPANAVTLDQTELDFNSAYTGYSQPAAKTVTITNTSNLPLTFNQPVSTSSFEVGTLSDAELSPGEKATFTVQPKTGLAAGTYSETIEVTGSGGVKLSLPVTFTVRQYISPPTKTPSQQATDKIEAAKEGDTVEISLNTGSTKLDKEVFEELAGRDVTLEISVPGGITWTVNGQDIPENATLTDLNLGVSMNTSTIPVDLINLVTGEKGAVQMTLAHDGPFGFTMTMTAPVGGENAGLWANLYHYDATSKRMLFETAAQVDEEGNVSLALTHASQYAIVLDTKSHELPFEDVGESDWYTAAVEYMYRQDIMTGTSATTFEPNTPLSRAMVAQILYNLEGQPAVAGESTFADEIGHWAANAIAWAQENGVVNGYEDNTFRPNKAVTREELAQMLYNYAQYKEILLPAVGDLSKFSDGDKVSSWAQTAMKWATGLQVINGYEDNTLRPGGNTTRAEAATMTMGLATTLMK